MVVIDHLPPLHFVTQLWGSSYVSLYADYALQSLMCEGNLPALSGCEDAVYEIYTTEADRAALEANTNFRRVVKELESWIEFRFVHIAGKIEDPYAVMSGCHRKAIAAAEERNAAILFLQPDVIAGDGTLRTVREQLLAGKRLVMSPGLRTVREVMEEVLRSQDGVSTGHCMPVRELVAHAVANLHPISRALLWRNGQIHSYCSHLYWMVGEFSLYARCAHMHPLMVFPRQRGCGFDHTIDWDYFYRACPDINDWFVASTSDEICLIELSGRTKFEGTENWLAATPETVANFLAVASEKPHLELLAAPYLFIGQKLEFSDWVEQNREGEKVVHAALMRGNTLSIMPSIALASRNTMSPKLERCIAFMVRFKSRLSRLRIIRPLSGRIIYYSYCSVYFTLRAIWRLTFKRWRCKCCCSRIA